jgi:NAD(P)-dependent dehydrogenase (short-subunit alcohol dehydrogenase family)
MAKVGTIKGVIKKIIECFKNINVTVNDIKLASNQLMEGKCCIVTGASRGIGREIARELLNSGAIVIGIGTSEENLEKVKKEFSCDKFMTYCCDVSEVEKLDQYFEDFIRMFENNKITTLINCAGIKNGNDERFFDYSESEFDEVLDVNVKAVFFWCQKTAKYFAEHHVHGHIVNVASIKGFIGEASPYGISKWGCVGLTKGLGRLLADKGIVVNGVAPGGTATDMANRKDCDLSHNITANKRLALPSEIAKIAVFLASDMGDNIVGEVIISDGGQSLQY